MSIDIRLIAIAATILVLHVVIAFGFLTHKTHAREERESQFAELQQKWAAQDQDREQKQAEELEAKYGANRLDRIALDNRLGILLELEKLCAAIFPKENFVTVKADRFTEFSIYVTMPDVSDTKLLAGYLKDILSRVDPRWIHEVIFRQEKNLRVVDQAKLLKVDWKNADLPEIIAVCLPGS